MGSKRQPIPERSTVHVPERLDILDFFFFAPGDKLKNVRREIREACTVASQRTTVSKNTFMELMAVELRLVNRNRIALNKGGI